MKNVFTGILPDDPKIPHDLISSLTSPGWDLVNRGGKRWRPLLMLLSCECIAGEDEAKSILPLTPLVEFPHNASLIHDDIEDSADERRGKPAVHLIYGMDTAINSGTFMYFLPLACLSAWNNEYFAKGIKEKIWEIWALHMRALHLGQAMDIAWHRDFLSLPGLEEYDRMCRLKTGCLARLAAVLGVNLGAAVTEPALEINSPTEKTVKNLSEKFGTAAEQLGVGFQIIDDVKNLKTGVPGKKRGDDIVEGKKSLPVLMYLHRYPHKRDFAALCFKSAKSLGTTAPEVEELISVMEEAGVLEEAAEQGLKYLSESKNLLSGLSGRKEGMDLLIGLIDSLALGV